MSIDQNKIERMHAAADDAVALSNKLDDLAFDLAKASQDHISPGDVDLSALTAAETFIREHKRFLERL